MLCGKFVSSTIAKTYVFKISCDFEMLYLCYFSTNHFQTSQHLLILGRFFQLVEGLADVSMNKVWKKESWKRLLNVKLLLRGLSFFLLNLNVNLSVSHLDRFDLRENRALKFENLYNFLVCSSEFPSQAPFQRGCVLTHWRPRPYTLSNDFLPTSNP